MSTVGRAGLTGAQAEIFVPAQEPAPSSWIVERDTIETDRPPGRFHGTVYAWWMAHSADPHNPCRRDPVTDPHEDLAYVGMTCRHLFVRMREHLSRTRPDGRPNNSAVYRHRADITGVSIISEGHRTADELDAAEDRAIKTLWPAWNIQGQDPRNPHAMATRAYRRPDRLAPLIGAASVGWGLFLATVTAIFLGVAWVAEAPWWVLPLCPVLAAWVMRRTTTRHKASTARRRRKR